MSGKISRRAGGVDPFIVMDVPAGNALPDPYRPGETQPAYPWRGRITCDPARVAELDAGKLSVGSVADICIFDPNARWKVEAAAIVSQGKHTPFAFDISGMSMTGRVRATVAGGQLAYQDAA